MGDLMRERYIPALVMLLAGAVTSIINIVNKVKVFDGLKRLLIVLVLFYIVGLIIKAIIVNTIINAPKKGEELQQESDETDEEEGKLPEGKQPEGK